MGPIQHAERLKLPSIDPEPERLTSGNRSALRVVMVVANDVTRDSRVLREAAVLAERGHRVTVLGMKTTRTTAPDVEVRNGFVIRRLPYRARPPGWWIPPDFYGRVRYRSDRQYRIHRARIASLTRQAHRRTRHVGSTLRATPGQAFAAVGRAVRSARLMHGLVRLPQAMTGAGSYIPRASRRSQSLLRRARRAPLAAWPHKAHVVTGDAFSAVRRRRPRIRIAPLVKAIRPRLEVERQVSAAVRSGETVGRAVRAWAGIVALLAWGSAYLLANRVTRGALEWQTGWRWRWIGWARYVAAHAPDADVWHGHDMTSLPAIVELKRQRGGFAVYDSHEVYLESGRHADQPRWAKAPLEALERRLARGGRRGHHRQPIVGGYPGPAAGTDGHRGAP